MKTLLIISLLGLGAWLWFAKEGSILSQAISGAIGMGDAKSEFVNVVDQNGRSLKCKLTAKHDSFVRIQRELDGQEFVIALSTLAEKSERQLGRIADFNQDSLKAELLKLAGKAIKPELLYIQELCTFRCQYTGQRMKSSEGMLVDAYREYLREQGFNYREVNLQAEKAGNGGFYMPDGIKDTPCIRVGETLIYKRNREQIEEAMIKYYVTMHRGKT